MRPAARSTRSDAILAARLSEILGQQVVIENAGGAGGMTGAARVAKSAPDGYTVLLSGSAVLAINQTLYKKPLYNAVTDFEHVALFSDSARVLITRKDLPANTLPEFVAYAKANQGKMQYGSAGVGSGTMCAAVLLDVAMGTKITHVPYRGAGPAMQDLIGGRIDFIAEQISTALPQIQGNAVKAIATLGLDRAPGLEDLPTAQEMGLSGLDCGSWGSLSFPKGTPDDIVRRLAKASNEAVETPAVRERFKGIGVTIPARGAQNPGISGQVRSERDRAMGRPDQGERSERGLKPHVRRRPRSALHHRGIATEAKRPLKPQETHEAFEPGSEAMLTRLIAAALAVVVLAPLHPLNAQDWPARTVTMVVPFPAGGPLDVVARILAQPMGELLGQQIIIENIGGAGGSTGSSRVAKAAPDGYVFLYGNSGTHAYSQLLTKKPPYDAVNDFAPVAVFVENSKVLVTRKDLAGRHAGRVHRLRQSQPGTNAIRIGRRRLGHPCELCPAQRRDRRRCHPCSVSRHRTGDAGSHGRAHRLYL